MISPGLRGHCNFTQEQVGEGHGESPALCSWVPTVAAATASDTNTGLCVDTGPGQKLPNLVTASAVTVEGRGAGLA